jgi:ribulose-phosphate 3-epimerase
MSIWQALPRNRLLAELSLWSADLAHLSDEMYRTEQYADLYHIDASDGHFAPLLLFFPDLVARLRLLTRRLFHVHLMAEGATLFQQIADFTRAGADLITIHAENGAAVPEALDAIQRDHVATGLALGLDTPVEAVVPYLDRIALVTMMGTRIGIKGQDLAEQACPRIRALQHLLHASGYADTIKIAADGGIREQTVPALRAAGADTVVMGSLAYNSADLDQTFRWLWSLPEPMQENRERR